MPFRPKSFLFVSTPRHFKVLWPSALFRIRWLTLDNFPLRVNVTIGITYNEHREFLKYHIKISVVGVFPLIRGRNSAQVQEHSANDHCYKGPNDATIAISILWTLDIYHYVLDACETVVKKTSSAESGSNIPTKIILNGPNSHIIKFIVRKPEVVVRKINHWMRKKWY